MTFLKNSNINGICAPLLLLPSYHEEQRSRYGNTQMIYSEVALMMNYLLSDGICLQFLLLGCLC